MSLRMDPAAVYCGGDGDGMNTWGLPFDCSMSDVGDLRTRTRSELERFFGRNICVDPSSLSPPKNAFFSYTSDAVS